jgi:hypothetical protein
MKSRLHRGDRAFLLQRVQPALSGLMDGSLSTLAPIFAVVLATHDPRTAFFAGLATALGAGVSMAFSEGLSDTGELTGRGSPHPAAPHPQYRTALAVALLRHRFPALVRLERRAGTGSHRKAHQRASRR